MRPTIRSSRRESPSDVRTKRNYGPQIGTRDDYIQMVEHLDLRIGEILAFARRPQADGERRSSSSWMTMAASGCRATRPFRQQGDAVGRRNPRAVPDSLARRDSRRNGFAPGRDDDGFDRDRSCLPAESPRRQAGSWMARTCCRSSRARLRSASGPFSGGSGIPPRRSSLKAVRRRALEVFRRTSDAEVLFDLEADPGETEDLADQNPQIVGELKKALASGSSRCRRRRALCSRWIAAPRPESVTEPVRLFSLAFRRTRILMARIPVSRWLRVGRATAAAQIEGAAQSAGKGESIWDRFATMPGKIKNGDTPEIACDHYHRYEADFDLSKRAWHRALPALDRLAARVSRRETDRSTHAGLMIIRG